MAPVATFPRQIIDFIHRGLALRLITLSAILLIATLTVAGCESGSRAGNDDLPSISELRPGASLDYDAPREAALPARGDSPARGQSPNQATAQPTNVANDDEDRQGVRGTVIRLDVPMDHPLAQAWQVTEQKHLPPAVIADWRDNGFRLAELPLDRVAMFEAALGPLQRASRTRMIGMQRLGTFRVGPDYRQPVVFTYVPPGGEERRATLPPGVPQFLIRAEMVDRDRATIELKPQHHYEKLAVQPRTPREKALDGTIFNALALMTVTPADRVLVIGPTDEQPAEAAPPAGEDVTGDAAAPGPEDAANDSGATAEEVIPIFESAQAAPHQTKLGHLFLHQRLRGRPVKALLLVVIDMPRPTVTPQIAANAEPAPVAAAAPESSREAVAQLPQSPPEPVAVQPVTTPRIAAPAIEQPVTAAQPGAVAQAARPVSVDSATPSPVQPVAPRRPLVIEVTANDMPMPSPVQPQPARAEAVEAVAVSPAEADAESQVTASPLPISAEPAQAASAEPVPARPSRRQPPVISVQAEAIDEVEPRAVISAGPGSPLDITPVPAEGRIRGVSTLANPEDVSAPNASQNGSAAAGERAESRRSIPVIEVHSVEVIDDSTSVEEVEVPASED